MPRKKNADLSHFQDWLIEEKMLSDGSASVYASHVRATIPFLSDMQHAATVTSDFSLMAETVTRRALNSRRSVWTAFVEYASTVKGIVLALPLRSSRRDGVDSLPHEVRAALHFMTGPGRFLQKQVPALTWAHVAKAPSSVQVIAVSDPFKSGEVLEVDREHIEALMAWSQSAPGGSGPLLPIGPGKNVPYPSSRMRWELKAYKKSAGLLDIKPSSGAEVDLTSRAETEALLAARNGVTHHGYGKPKPFEPTGTTADLLALLEDQTQEPAGQETRAAEASGPTEEETPQPERDREPVLPESPPDGVCALCGFPRSVHACAFGLTDGTISNCAKDAGKDEEDCQMCDIGCYGRHDFRALA